MTDMTFAPSIINGFLGILIVADFLTGNWSLITTIALFGLISFNAFLFYLVHGPQKPPLTMTETINKYPELWGWYFREDWTGFWEINDSQTSSRTGN